KRLIVAAMRWSLILLIPAIGYAISAQLTTHSNKTGIDTKPAHHSAAHNKGSAGRNGHASPGTHGKNTTGVTSTGNQHAAGRHSGKARRAAHARSEATPTPSPTPTAPPESGLGATPSPSPMGGSTATP